MSLTPGEQGVHGDGTPKVFRLQEGFCKEHRRPFRLGGAMGWGGGSCAL